MADFHFIRPYWFLALIGLFLALYLLKKMRISQSGWQGLLPKHLAHVLIKNPKENKPLSLIMPFILGLLAIIAMAGPSWQKLPQPVYQLARGSVLIMDMSYSMYSTDLSPNRLTRARYKAIDLLDNINEGEMGLIAYAGDAFIISPLTEDINNIKLLLPSLSPELMPELGSDPMRALTLADEMLKNAGHIDGDIYWFTDGVESSEIQDITEWSRNHTYRLNILGVGTKNGAPIKLSNGEFMKDNNGAIVVPKLRGNSLKGLAERGNGQYVKLNNNSDDIKKLLKSANSLSDNKETEKKESSNTGDQWEEAGPYIILLMLPLVLMYFRRGRLLALFPLAILLTPTDQVYANVWDDLWKTKNQQAQAKFDQKRYKEAAEQFNDPLWQGSAQYKAGNFEEALKSFQQSDTAHALYNQGNALAKLNKLDEAIKHYEKALEKDPSFENAKANKALLEKLQEQQQQSDQNQKGDNQEEKDGDQDQSEQESQNSENNQDNNENSENQQQGDQQNSQQQNDQQNGEQDNSQSQNEESDEIDSEQTEEQKQAEKNDADESENNEQTQSSAEQQDEIDSEETEEQKAQAIRAAEKLAQESEQKHQQILNKVTDDPYQLLRNKMQLEYKKRRQNRSSLGATKKW
ncbi:vWA domain-containing protein [Pseudocolwellia agarivorans]|uniref:vWA domain-containing protein n=1 Tax=Pseudocolwellia agarivorans TaxID=1911682 RepID=UPI000984BFD4|nr:VWA domain-containing protein [Pseudocolwellia agarivorans]